MSFLSWIKEVFIETSTPEVPKQEQKQPQVHPPSDEEIKSKPEFQKALKELQPVYRWMTLAGGTKPMTPTFLSFDEQKAYAGRTSCWKVTLKTHGYDLFTRNLIEYRETGLPVCKKALDKFAVDLFDEHARKMSKIAPLEYIADHLITLENIHYDTASDFYLTYPAYVYLSDRREIDLLRQEIESTKIFDV